MVKARGRTKSAKNEEGRTREREHRVTLEIRMVNGNRVNMQMLPVPSPCVDPGIEEKVDFLDIEGLVVVKVEFNRLCKRREKRKEWRKGKWSSGRIEVKLKAFNFLLWAFHVKEKTRAWKEPNILIFSWASLEGISRN